MKFSLIALFAASAIAAPQFGGGKGKSATGLPTGFPTGFPTGLPSGFPTGFPTGFPSGFPTGSGFPFPTGGFGGGEDEDGSVLNAEAADPRPTGKGKGKGKSTGLPTGIPTGFPTGFPSGFPTGSGFPFPNGGFGGGEDEDGSVLNARADDPRPTGKGKGKGKSTGLPTGIPTGFPTGIPTGLPSGFPTGVPFPTGGFGGN